MLSSREKIESEIRATNKSQDGIDRQGLDQYQRIADVLSNMIEGNGGMIVENLEKFKGLDHKEIANKLIEEECRKREQGRNAQETGGMKDEEMEGRKDEETEERKDEEKEERIKTELTEEEQQEYIRLRNIKVMGEVMGKELSEEQKQRLEEFEIKLGGNDSNDARIEDTKGGELSQEEVTETGNSIEDLNELMEAFSKKSKELEQVKEHHNEIVDKALKLNGYIDELRKKQEVIRKKLEDYRSGKWMSQIILNPKPSQDELIQLESEMNNLRTGAHELSVSKTEAEMKIMTKEREIRVIKEKIEELRENNMYR